MQIKLKNLPLLIIALCLISISFLPLAKLHTMTEGFYCDTSYSNTGGNTVDTTLQFKYDYYTSTGTSLDMFLPVYSNVTKTNSCACVAALTVIGYYDVTLPDLIPDFEPGREYEGKYYFYGNTYTTIDLEAELYDLMGTNTIAPGTSIDQFKKGFTAYVKGKGYNITYNSCGSKFNVATANSYFERQIPVIVFLDNYEYYYDGGSYIADTECSLIGKKSTNAHVAAVFGYRQYKFYKDNKLIRTDNYLLSSFGDDSMGFLRINDLSCIDASYAINIF